MDFILKPYIRIGKLNFKDPRNNIRETLGSNYSEFKKSKFSKNTTDDFGFCHIFYDKDNNFEAVEFFPKEANVFLDKKNLSKLNFQQLKSLFESIDENLTITSESLTSSKLGISIYAPDSIENPQTIPESILVYCKNYFS